MPVLNKAKGIYRGSALVAFVRVASRVIWQARKIVGWNRIAGPYQVEDVTKRQRKITFATGSKDEFQNLQRTTDLYLKGDDGEYYKVTRVDPGLSSSVYIDVNVEDTIAETGSMISFYQPVWG